MRDRERCLEEHIALLVFPRKQYRDSLRHGLLENVEHCKSVERIDYDEMEKAEEELTYILKQGQFVREILQRCSTEVAENATVTDLYNSFRMASDDRQKAAARKPTMALPGKIFCESLVPIYSLSKQARW